MIKHITTVKKLVGGIGVFTALSLLASFCNFLFNFIMIRLLPAQEFRDLTLANNLINVFGNLFVALNIVSIAVFYISKDQQANIIRACQKLIYVMYVVLLGLCVIFNGAVQQRTGLHDALILNVTLAVIFFSIPVMVLNAIYLGMNRFNRSAIMNVCLALGRMLLGVAGAVLVATHKDVAAVAGILLVFVIVFGIFILFEKEAFRHQSFEVFKRIWAAPVHVLKQYRLLVISSLVYALTINFLLGLDLFIFGQFFSNQQSADYAAVSVIGKLIFFFIAPISLYLAVKQQAAITDRPGFALKTSAGVSGLIALVGIVLVVLPLSIVSLLVHRAPEAINGQYLLLSILFNGAVVLTNHQLIEAIVGKRQRTALLLSVALLAVNGAIFLFFHALSDFLSSHSPAQLALGIPAATMLAASVVLFLVTHVFRKKR
jgi:O-antigen/teichoic acid export membrane protein